MVKRFQKNWTLLFLLGLIISSLSCGFALQTEQKTYPTDNTYQIKPHTLLTSLANEEMDAFVLMTSTPPVFPDYALEPVPWGVSDYFFVAKELYQFAQNDTLDDWKLKEMWFSGKCDEINIGFQRAGFVYFKSIPGEESNIRVEATMFVVPEENIARYFDVVYTPELKEWNYIDLSQINISAVKALQIADINGGEKFRDSVNNYCRIVESYDAEGKYKGWTLTYSAENQGFKINIDPSTGDFRILR
jgi:hypothetical protein